MYRTKKYIHKCKPYFPKKNIFHELLVYGIHKPANFTPPLIVFDFESLLIPISTEETLEPTFVAPKKLFC